MINKVQRTIESVSLGYIFRETDRVELASAASTVLEWKM